jgi:hypothetical protein
MKNRNTTFTTMLFALEETNAASDIHKSVKTGDDRG